MGGIEHLLTLKLYHLFKHSELTEVMRQNDKLLNYLLNWAWVGNIDNDVKTYTYTRLIHECGTTYLAETNDIIPDNYKWPSSAIQAAQN